MRKRLSSVLCATTLLMTGAGMLAIPQPAVAQAGTQIGFQFFRHRLEPYGHWFRHPIWGDVWKPGPRVAGPDFQPYTNGYWEYTDDYGWYWVSNDAFDDVVYHYGRWVYDPRLDWIWVPGYTWSPAWVIWREGDDYTGWMPMPPDEDFVSGAGLGFGVNLGPIGINFYNRWYGGRVDPDRFFVFVGNGHLVERDYRRFRVPRDRVKIIIQRTRPSTKFEVVNNRVVNRGVDVRVVERATGRRIAPVPAKTVIKPNAVITTVSEAKQIRQRERASHPIDVNAVKRGNAGGGNQNPPDKGNAAGGGKMTGEGGANAPSNQNENRRGRGKNPAMGGPQSGEPAETTPEGGTNGQTGNRMRNPGGETMGGPTGETTGKNRTRGNANDNAGENANAPDQTATTPPTNPENPPVRRHRPGSTTPGNDRTMPSEAGTSPGDNGEGPSGNNPRRRSGSAGTMTGPNGSMSGAGGTMNGPNGTMGRSGAGQPENGGMNGPSPKKQKAQPSQPGSTDAEQKDKRKPKSPSTEEPGSPQQ